MAIAGNHGYTRGLVDMATGQISREIFVNEAIYQQELEQVFARAWLFVGHESQIPKPGDSFVSGMGEESVILCRDREEQIHVFLNTCRHRGMKVCRYDEGNTPVFTCPYHGWSYANDGKLVGVPCFKEAYHGRLDKSKWGLVEVAQLSRDQGTVWATWDQSAPPFLDYLGDCTRSLDLSLDAWDGREGGTEVLGGIQKWLMPCNWKFPAENFSGDSYHNISHRSVDMVGIGPSGSGRRDTQERQMARRLHVCFAERGHQTGVFVLPKESPTPLAYQHSPVVSEYFRQCEEARRRRGEWGRLMGSPGEIFPNTALHPRQPRTIAVWHPLSGPPRQHHDGLLYRPRAFDPAVPAPRAARANPRTGGPRPPCIWSGVGWSGVGRGAVSCYARAEVAEEPEPGIFRAANARYRCEDMDRDGVDAELVNGPYEQISAIKDPELRVACVRVVNDWARELYEESNGRFIMLLPLPCQTPEEAVAELMRVAEFGLPTGVIFDWVNAPEPVLHQMWEPVWAAAAGTSLPINLHANPRGGSRQLGVGVSGLEPRNQSLMRVANFPMGLMAELMSAVVFAGICDRHPGVRFVLEEAGVGWVPFLFWRFDREYDWGDPSARVFQPDILLSDKPTAFVKRQVFFTFEVEEEGGFRRVPEVGLRNFLWASDFPGLDSPWPHSKAMGHAPVEAALGKEALNQLVFENAVRLYKIPVTLPQERALT